MKKAEWKSWKNGKNLPKFWKKKWKENVENYWKFDENLIKIDKKVQKIDPIIKMNGEKIIWKLAWNTYRKKNMGNCIKIW